METTNLLTLQIHKLTQDQYDRAVESGRIDENALYLTPEEVIQSNYEQNNSLEADYIKNRPFYSLDNILEWNGAPEGLDIIDGNDSGFWVKVSNNILTYEDFINGGSVTKSNSENAIITTTEFNQSDLIISDDKILGDGFYIDTNGIYFFLGYNENHTSSLTIKTIKQLDKKYVPNIDWGTKVDNRPFDTMDTLKKMMVDFMYPVGHILMTTNSANPSTYLEGTTWEEWGSGRVPVGVNTNDESFKNVEQEGGEKTHTLTTDEMAKHKHSIPSLSGTTSETGAHTHVSFKFTRDGLATGSDAPRLYGYGASNGDDPSVTSSDGKHSHTVTTDTSSSENSGSGKAHNNLQPYITCYMWKRTK